jgi:hypothetical protein
VKTAGTYWDDDFLYRVVKSEARLVFDEFLQKHRLTATKVGAEGGV